MGAPGYVTALDDKQPLVHTMRDLELSHSQVGCTECGEREWRLDAKKQYITKSMKFLAIKPI